MTLLVYVLIYIALVGGFCWLVNYFARRKRRGLEKYGTPADTGDPIANAERAMPGASARAYPTHGQGPTG